VLHCLRHYREDDDARYGLDHEGELVPFEFTPAYLLGLDARPFVPSVATSVRQLLDRFDGDSVAEGEGGAPSGPPPTVPIRIWTRRRPTSTIHTSARGAPVES
jgi:hypothetical protein